MSSTSSFSTPSYDCINVGGWNNANLLKWWHYPDSTSKEEQNLLLPKENKAHKYDAQFARKRRVSLFSSHYVRSILEIVAVITVVACCLKLLSFRATDHVLKQTPSFLLHRSGGKIITGGRYLQSVFRPIKRRSPVRDELTIDADVSLGVNAELERAMDIYCRGPLLHAVQMTDVFSDSKHFVDMPIKENSSAFDILVDFQRRKLSMTEFQPSNNETHTEMLQRFLDDHFDPPDAELREWAFGLHQIWQSLGRIHNPHVKSSLLLSQRVDELSFNQSANVLIVPGGRFRESYYWDSYWIVQGLLVCDMPITARGVVNHLLEYVSDYGIVPNGGRIYYLTRSQPPMLSDMVKLVARIPSNESEYDYDDEYLRAALPILEREYEFWMQHGPSGHAVEMTRRNENAEHPVETTYVLNRYTSSANHPRPESYREDVRTAAEIFDQTMQMNDGNAAATERRKDMFYNNVIAAAESGWDFSSRWMRDPLEMKTMMTTSVIPVDLNSIMYRVERNLMKFNLRLGNEERAQFFEQAAARRLEAIDAILWSEKHKSWKDYNLETDTHSSIVSVSDYFPLWAKAFNASDIDRLKHVVASFKRSGLLQVGGVQTTTTISGQQWDSPNAWPPLQDIIVEGLLAVNTGEAYSLAREIAKKWTHTGLTAWKQTGLMFEKYNASEIGGLGAGGEYFPQFGFGWTNGVILKFLTIHQSLLTAE
ncbi:trehalase (brush-border membrane glycoprotein) variant [Plasmopara halstedii]|uniref:Trehalase n=1 Tax=Plasmopara halstedii TaxID=4781 RepID=A0A0P1B7Z4_PLAHL|nr:trehalase (brush-border membrane glycoprotein) variant [Plasmopara halstedii]CEG50110.1 trehalase (brush-border membrane glycoprotein) variant [Plasmopara halstedii]|eukprot:XP_024586479.1 trehalase (brush-border membrane glycoprotein) variant [Plasmopara halstedii]